MVGNYDKETGKKIVKLINEIKVKQMDYTKTLLATEGKKSQLEDMLDKADKKEVERLLDCSELYYTYKSMVDSIGDVLSKLTGDFMKSMLENEEKQEQLEDEAFSELDDDVNEDGLILADILSNNFDYDDVIKVICGGNVVYYGAIKDGIRLDAKGKLDPYIGLEVINEKYEGFVPVFYVKAVK